MRPKKPLISFIVTVYNLEKYISSCLDSILNQNFNNYEIVLVDNASTDNSSRICQIYAVKNPDKIRYFQVPKEIAVMGTAHYFGFGIASGEYVQFIDGDDRLKDNCLSEIASLITSKKTDIIMGRFECYLEESNGNKNNFNDAVFEADKINNVPYDQALIYLSTLANFQGVFWRYIFRKSLFERNYKEVGDIFHYPFYSTLYADGIMLIKLFLKANSIFYMDKTIYLYTRRSNGSGVGFLNPVNLSKDSIITFLSALYFLISLKPKNGKRVYLINKIYYIFKFYKFGLTYVEDHQYSQIAQILEENIELLEAIKECDIADLQDFYTCIKENGCLNGIIFYTNQMKNNFLKRLSQSDSENIYIIPNGNKTMSTLNLLHENGYDACGIFDNDPQKNGLHYQGVPCYTPEVLSTWNIDRKSAATFIVSAMDETLVDLLTNQLKEFGIKETQIIVKE